MKTQSRFLLIFASAALLLGTVPIAQATPTISIALDGGPEFICADQSLSCDVDGGIGSIGIQVVPGFILNLTNGVTKPLITNPLMGFNSLSVPLPSTSPIHTLVLKFSETGFTGLGDIGGNFATSGIGFSSLAQAFIGTGNTLFEETSEIASIAGPIGSFADFTVSGGGAYSLTQVVTLTLFADASPAFDFRLTQETVPEPTTSLLVGLGLASLTAIRRRLQLGCKFNSSLAPLISSPAVS